MKGRPGNVSNRVAAILARATSPPSAVNVRVWSWLVRNGDQRYAGRVSSRLGKPVSSPAAEPVRTADKSESDSSQAKYAVSWAGEYGSVASVLAHTSQTVYASR